MHVDLVEEVSTSAAGFSCATSVFSTPSSMEFQPPIPDSSSSVSNNDVPTASISEWAETETAHEVCIYCVVVRVGGMCSVCVYRGLSSCLLGDYL